MSDRAIVPRNEDEIFAIRSAYHERVRLGLGSPFRLIEIAAHDVRLDGETREDLAQELFERIAGGDTYQAIQTLPPPHQRVVEYAVSAAADPRVGELAVNLAYEIATWEKTVTREVQYAATATAAMLRDRALAQRDAEYVAGVARTRDLPPHALVPLARAQRALAVEQPFSFAALDIAAQDEASKLALLFIGGVRQAARMQVRSWATEPVTQLSASDAERILALDSTITRPPQSALIIAMRQSNLPLIGEHEESFVAELAQAPSTAVAHVAAQRAAIALRPMSQERIWHAQTKSPSNEDLLLQFGVQFAVHVDVPEQWHAYYRTQLADALTDMRRVLPGMSMKGLTIEIANVDSAAILVAFHDPLGRIIRLAPRTGTGSLAHELGHDLDWQIARRAYRRRAAYASDYALDVSAAMAITAPGTEQERATEILAQQFDWIVAMMLAAQGRMNGTLSAVQHEWLRGHGGARPPVASAQSARVFAGALGRAIALDDTTRSAIERAVLAYRQPATVRVIRALRSSVGRIDADAGEPVSPAANAFINALSIAAGVITRVESVEQPAARNRNAECSAFKLKPCL